MRFQVQIVTRKGAALFAPFLFLAATGFSQSSKLSTELQNLELKGDVRVIVEYDHDPSDSDHQRIVHRGGHYRHALHSVRGGSYLLPSAPMVLPTPTTKFPAVTVSKGMASCPTPSPQERGYPLGFKNKDEFNQAMAELQSALAKEA
jgi:hypothetical protein